MTVVSSCIYLLLVIAFCPGGICDEDGSHPQFCGDGMQFQDKCYWFSSKAERWVDAHTQCNQYGPNVRLIVVTNKKQQDWLRSTLPYRDMWLGLYDAHEDGQWLWVDGTYPNYTNWEPQLSNSSDQHCALMSHRGGQWQQTSCSATKHYACSSTPNYPICHSGGIFFRDRCYWLARPKSSLSQAQDACDQIEKGAQVVIIRDGEVNAFLSKLVYPAMWIGLTDAQNEGHFEWADGSQLTFTNWFPGEPNNDNNREDCTVMYYGTGAWNDMPCRGYSHAVVCALPPCDIEGSGDAGPCIDENPHCSCVSGGYCIHVGKCHCRKRFHGMVCDRADVRVRLRTASHVTEGGSIELKCHVNIPQNDYSLQLKHVKVHDAHTPLPEIRTKFHMDQEENGFLKVVIYNATTEDTGNYLCVVSTTVGVLSVTKIDSAYVKVKSKVASPVVKKHEPGKATAGDTNVQTSGDSAIPGLTVAVAVLAACCVLLVIALVVVKILARRREGDYRAAVRMSSLLSQ